MGICRGTNTRFQFCGKNTPALGVYPNVCGASIYSPSPGTTNSSSVAMDNAKLRRVVGNDAVYLSREVNDDQVSGNASSLLGNVPYNGRYQVKSTCAESRGGGVGKMFLRGRAKRCFANGCYCDDRRTS